MIDINNGLSFLIWHMCSDEMYLVKSDINDLEEVLDIMSYIQCQNFIACPSFEMSVKDFCIILNKYFAFKLNPRNYYDVPSFRWKQEIGNVIKIKYDSAYKHKTRSKKAIFLIELSSLWSLYKANDLPKSLSKDSEVGNIIQKFVKTLPNAQPWF